MRMFFPLFLLFAPPPEQGYEQALAELEVAMENSTADDRQAAIEGLEGAIDLASSYPGEALDDGSVPEPTLLARVILVRLYLAEGDEDAARTTMDELIRTARSQTPPVRSYGREVSYLYEDRKSTLEAEGLASIEVDCAVPCEVVINQRRTPELREELLLGSYQVWVRASDEDASWELHEVELSSADAVETVVYEDPSPPPPTDAPPPLPPPAKRMLPRAVEIAGVAVGVGLLVTGAILLSFDGKCSETSQRPTDATTQDECGDIYESTVGGVAMLGAGGGLLVVSGVLLSIDEVRVGRTKGRQVMVGVSLRF